MKKIFAYFAIAASFAATNAYAQSDSTRFTWNAGFNLAPQSVYQFGDKKPSADIAIFATTTFSTRNAAVCAFYNMKGHSAGLFLSRNLTSNWSLYGVGSKNLCDRGKYVSAGMMYQFGKALVFCELGAPLNVENTNLMVCAGFFIGFGKDIKKWK